MCTTCMHCNPRKQREHTATYRHTLLRTATHFNIRQHTATYGSTLQHTAAHCNVRQHTATYGNALQYTMHFVNACAYIHTHTHIVMTRSRPLQHTATHCNTLHHTTSHCNTLHHSATHCIKVVTLSCPPATLAPTAIYPSPPTLPPPATMPSLLQLGPMIQGSKDAQEVLICRSFPAKEPLIIWLFCAK